MLRWINEHTHVSQGLNVVLAWLVVLAYALWQKPTFSQFWPAVIALAGLHTIYHGVQMYTQNGGPK